RSHRRRRTARTSARTMSRVAVATGAGALVPAGGATHRFRVVTTPGTRFVRPQRGQRPNLAASTSVYRTTTGTSGHPTGDALWNGRGQRCELTDLPVHTTVDDHGLSTGGRRFTNDRRACHHRRR